MSEILDEIRDSYALWGVELVVATYGTYYRLRCGRCGNLLGFAGNSGSAINFYRSSRQDCSL